MRTYKKIDIFENFPEYGGFRYVASSVQHKTCKSFIAYYAKYRQKPITEFKAYIDHAYNRRK